MEVHVSTHGSNLAPSTLEAPDNEYQYNRAREYNGKKWKTTPNANYFKHNYAEATDTNKADEILDTFDVTDDVNDVLTCVETYPHDEDNNNEFELRSNQDQSSDVEHEYAAATKDEIDDEVDFERDNDEREVVVPIDNDTNQDENKNGDNNSHLSD